MIKLSRLIIATLIVVSFLFQSCKSSTSNNPSEYDKINQELLTGWGTFNTQNALSYVLMPEGFELGFAFKYQGKNFGGYLERAQFEGGLEWKDAKVRAIAHAYDASYTKIEVEWEDIHCLIETATEGKDFVALITPVGKQKYPSHAIVYTGILWNKPGALIQKENHIRANFKNNKINVYQAVATDINYNVPVSTPYLSFSMDTLSGISTGKKRTLDEIQTIISNQKQNWDKQGDKYGKEMREAYQAITTCMAWNSIYDPVNNRLVSTVSRPWNVNRGGYGFFGWDNFFLSYLAALDNKELAFSNVIAHLNDVTEEGFISNNTQGNGRKAWDRSQPPVGGIVVKEIYKKYPERWFLEATFPKLLTWNDWWMKRRFYKGVLCWGSHLAKNPYHDECFNNHCGARMESGLDDSPMWDGMVYNADSMVMEVFDVGLNSLYVADCEAIADMARELGHDSISDRLLLRAEYFRNKVKELWSEEDGIFLNKNLTTNEFSHRLSPTLFYALMAKAATPEQAQRMITEHFYNPDEFWGDWIMPSIARNDTTFYRQKYWKGAVWAPLNYLVYLSFRQYDLPKPQKDLSDKSLALFVKEWNRKKYVSENYSAIDGSGDDPRIKSDRFYTWGALMGMIPFIEEKFMPNPSEMIKEIKQKE